jgi:hypothetical protein
MEPQPALDNQTNDQMVNANDQPMPNNLNNQMAQTNDQMAANSSSHFGNGQRIVYRVIRTLRLITMGVIAMSMVLLLMVG